jgi:hypothetical protein
MSRHFASYHVLNYGSVVNVRIGLFPQSYGESVTVSFIKLIINPLLRIVAAVALQKS